MLWMLQRVVLGPASTHAASLLQDLSARETATLVPLAVLIFVVGVFPGPLMELLDASVMNLVEQVGMPMHADVAPVK
jgi:NADH-quinone oxidoreductase subunit M